MLTIKYTVYTPKSLRNINQAQKAVQIHPICISDTYHNYILYEKDRRDKIEYKGKLHNVE